jgi:hypothetical protein
MAAEIGGARRKMAAPARGGRADRRRVRCRGCARATGGKRPRGGLDRIERQGHLDAVSAGP